VARAAAAVDKAQSGGTQSPEAQAAVAVHVEVGSMSRTHYSVSVQGRIGMAGNMGRMMVVHTAAWVGHCRIPICTHLQVPTIGCCSQRPRCMEVLVVDVHAIVTAV
jgi:hypothetical protein